MEISQVLISGLLHISRHATMQAWDDSEASFQSIKDSQEPREIAVIRMEPSLEDFFFTEFAQSFALQPDRWNDAFFRVSFRGFSLDAFSADSFW